MVPADLRERLLTDTPFYAANCLKIVDKRAQLVPLIANGAQLRLQAAIDSQRNAGLPVRIINLKSRKLGFSTWSEASIFQETTQRAFIRALVVGQDKDTASELFGMAERMYLNLPRDPDLSFLRPPLQGVRRGAEMHFGEPSRIAREAGVTGLDSKLQIDTANEVEAGRGFTYTHLHLTEVAFWPDPRKMTSLLNAVPDEPGTVIIIESTANGSNHFKARWDDAEKGRSNYIPVFAGWTEDPAATTPFPDEDARRAFIDNIGEGPLGQDEPGLIERFGCTPEQLHWRRRAIADKAGGSLEEFKQEYPASAEEAFMSSGKHVFSQMYVSSILHRCRTQTDPEPLAVSPELQGPNLGVLEAGRMRPRKTMSGITEVPEEPRWREAFDTPYGSLHPWWRVWEYPREAVEAQSLEEERVPMGRYVIGVDPMSGEETEEGELAYHGVTVIDHRSRVQVAEYSSRIDPDLLAIEILLAARWYNDAWIIVERTGGYGLSILRKLWKEWRYPYLYKSRPHDRQNKEKTEDRLGWDTNRPSKTLLEDGAKELIRPRDPLRPSTQVDGIRSRLIALEMTTYVKDDKGKTGPEPNEHSDKLISWMLAQQGAQELPVLRDKKTSSTGRGTVAVS